MPQVGRVGTLSLPLFLFLGRADHPWSAAVERGRSTLPKSDDARSKGNRRPDDWLGCEVGARLRRVRRPELRWIAWQAGAVSHTANGRHAVAPLPKTETLPGPRSRPSGPWYGYPGSGAGSGILSSDICPLSSIQYSIQPSIDSSCPQVLETTSFPPVLLSSRPLSSRQCPLSFLLLRSVRSRCRTAS
jgi:hypothetical protein